MAELARIFSVFPIPGETREDRKVRLQTYWDTIKDLPPYAVEAAGTKVRRGVYPELNRSFAPTPAEFSELVRGVLVANPTQREADADLEFDGEVPMTWIREGDPRWPALVAIEKRANPKSRPLVMSSKWAPGRGRFFRSEYVRQVPRGTARRALPVAERDKADLAAQVKAAMSKAVDPTKPHASQLPAGSIVTWDQVDRFPVIPR